MLIGLWSIGLFLLLFWKHTQLAHHAEQALRPAGIPPLPQTVPQFYQAQGRIVAAHIPDLLQLRFCVLVGMAVRTPGLAGQGFDSAIPASPPEVDIRPASVVLPAGTADAVFLRVFH